MATIAFKAADLLPIVEHALAATKFKSSYGVEVTGPELWFVGDHGIYLMSNGDPGDKISEEPVKLRVAYADGMNPEIDAFDDWWEKKRMVLGGDDMVQQLPWCLAIKEMIDNGATTIKIRVNKNSMSLL